MNEPQIRSTESTAYADRLAENLRSMRARRRMTQEQVAARAGISPHTVWRVEQGKGATFDTVARIASALGCSLDDLLVPVAA
jgi:transcriptional regulator with XRE-family HTH domain